MIRLRNPRSLTLPLLALIALAIPAEAAAVKPAAGDYEARPAKIDQDYQMGAFSVVNEGGDRRIVASELYDGIYYPDLGECDSFTLPLAAESIPVSASGRFSVRERTPVRKSSVLVVWKGRWVKPKKVAGTIRVAYKDCSAKVEWVGSRIPPAT